MNRIFIGYDPRESLAYRVCIASMLAHTKQPFAVEPVNMRLLGDKYTRPTVRAGGVLLDTISNSAPMSTEFSLARFFVPHMAGYTGWALYCDGDFMWRAPVEDLFALADSRYALQVVKHDHVPMESTKMDGQRQTAYPRKNWSSLMLINCGHPGMLSLADANRLTGAALHRFAWLRDDAIGGLPPAWNHLVGVCDYTQAGACKAAHFTLGTPDMPGYERHGSFLSDEWRNYADS